MQKITSLPFFLIGLISKKAQTKTNLELPDIIDHNFVSDSKIWYDDKKITHDPFTDKQNYRSKGEACLKQETNS